MPGGWRRCRVAGVTWPPSGWMLAWVVGVAVIIALSVVLVIGYGVASLAVMGPVVAVFASAPGWWRLAGLVGGDSSNDGPNAGRDLPAPTDAAIESRSSARRPGTAEFRELLAALAVAISEPEVIYPLAERTMERPYLIRRGGGPRDAIGHWQRVVECAWKEGEDADVLNEALAVSNSPQLRVAVERWLNGT